MKIKFLVFAALLLTVHMSYAQKKGSEKAKVEEESDYEEDDSNLVPNGGFENASLKNLKDVGQLTSFATPWDAPTKASADLFNVNMKSPKVGAPLNYMGTQDPYNGDNYAGFRGFTKDPKKNRSYLQVKLKEKMAKNQLYCVKFNISVAELSKVSVNNVGMFISDRKVNNDNFNALTFDPQIKEKNNKPITTMDGWETICGTFIGTGQEEYIIIGAFGTENQLKQEKLKKPVGVTGVVSADAYYYIDNIEIVAVDAQSQCFCGKAEDKEPDLIYSRASAKTLDMKPVDQINNTAVWFSYLSADIPEQFLPELDELATLLKANPSISLSLTGHCEVSENLEAKVNTYYTNTGAKRAEAVKSYLTKSGVDASKIEVINASADKPATDRTTPLAKAQNRRVEFKVK
jgi:outer membrane protein OmpA-like peptidoglycan-associated protein